jgi:type II secretory pathway pseudopilin PulG
MSRQRGFTIIEAMIAFTVVVVAMMATLGALGSSFGSVQTNSQRMQAVAAAQEYLDSIRQWEQAGGAGSMPTAPVIAIDAGDNGAGTGASLSSPGNFDFTTVPATCTQTGAGGASSKQYNCTVTVGWTIGGATRQLAVETYVTQQ